MAGSRFLLFNPEPGAGNDAGRASSGTLRASVTFTFYRGPGQAMRMCQGLRTKFRHHRVSSRPRPLRRQMEAKALDDSPGQFHFNRAIPSCAIDTPSRSCRVPPAVPESGQAGGGCYH